MLVLCNVWRNIQLNKLFRELDKEKAYYNYGFKLSKSFFNKITLKMYVYKKQKKFVKICSY